MEGQATRILLLRQVGPVASNKIDRSYRSNSWDDADEADILSALAQRFPASSGFEIFTLRSNDTKLMSCFLCIARLVAGADVLIGTHGPELSRLISMPPGSLVIEVIPFGMREYFHSLSDFAMLAFAMGHHHYMYEPPLTKEMGQSTVQGATLIRQVDGFLRHLCAPPLAPTETLTLCTRLMYSEMGNAAR
jgi:hypothetical protein